MFACIDNKKIVAALVFFFVAIFTATQTLAQPQKHGATGPKQSKKVTDQTLTQEGKPMPTLSDAIGTAPPVAQGVTGDRIVRARSEPQNWMTYYGAYDGQHYSSLDQINTSNVKNLKPAWVFQYGVIGLQATPATYSFEAAPIIVDGVMYLSGWDGLVWALDAVNGQLLWQYKHAIPLGTPLCCGNVNRGVAVAMWKVFVATANCVEDTFRLDPFSGHLFVFCNRGQTILKVLYWDRNGFCLWQKRLEKHRFKWPQNRHEVMEIGAQELSFILEGLDIRTVRPLDKLSYKSLI